MRNHRPVPRRAPQALALLLLLAPAAPAAAAAGTAAPPRARTLVLGRVSDSPSGRWPRSSPWCAGRPNA